MLGVRIALFRDPTDSPHPVDVSWEDLARELSTVETTACAPCRGKDCPAKRGKAWSPADYHEGAPRGNAYVRAITVAVFDLEAAGHSPLADSVLRSIEERLQGTRYVLHTTHSGRGFYRLVVALDNPIAPGDWPRFWQGAVSALGLEGAADPHCSDPARIFFLPTAPEGAPFAAEIRDGRPLEVSKILTASPAEDREKISLDLAVPDLVTDLDGLRGELRRLRRPESHAAVRKILAGDPLPEGGHDATLNKWVSLVVSAPDQIPTFEAVLEVLRPSLAATAPCQGTLEASWAHHVAEARDMYARAIERRLARDQKDAELKGALDRVLGQEPGKIIEGTPDEWRLGLRRKLRDDGEPGGLERLGLNAFLIMKNDPDWKDGIRWNVVTKQIEITRGPLKDAAVETRHIEATNWLAASTYNLTLKSHEVGEQMLAVAMRSTYDPLADWLTGLTWDGTPRAQFLLERYYRAAGNSSYLRAVSARWLISTVARGLQPGCKVDTMLILQGGQGKNKTRSLEVLGGPFYKTGKLDVSAKDGQMIPGRCWIFEMGELTSLKRSDAESLKAFFSQREDFYRPPYGQAHISVARRCVFVGTTNDEEYLTDPTGNRRYWPVRVELVDVDALQRDRDQLFAEAVWLFRHGEPWWLTDPEKDLLDVEHRGVLQPCTRTEQILEWFLRLKPEERPRSITTTEIATHALGMLKSQITKTVQIEIGVAVRQLGWTKHRKRQGGIPIWVFEPPEEMSAGPRLALVE